MAWIFFLLFSVAIAGPKSAQTTFERSQTAAAVQFDYAWKDASGKKRKLTFALPKDGVDADREEVTWMQRKLLYEHVAKEVRAFAKKQKKKGVTMKVKVDKGVQISASGPPKEARAALNAAEILRDEATEGWLVDHDFMRMKNGDVSFDHASLAASYAKDLRPVAKALRKGTKTDREFIERALSFVQSIPYEKRKMKGGDPGYRRPLALLFRNRGDCDSKAVLFLGIVHAELPKLPLAMVYVPGHALTGVGLDKDKGDKMFKADGVKFIYAEPVGPALHGLGTPDPANKKSGKKGEVVLL